MTNIYIVYHPLDASYKEEFLKYLNPIEARIWDDSQIIAGSDFAQIRKKNLLAADYILVLLSADLISESDQLDDIKSLQETHQKKIISVMLRPAAWQDTWLSSFPLLPLEEQHLVSNRQFDEQAGNSVGMAIKQMIKSDLEKAQKEEPTKERSFPFKWLLLFALILIPIVYLIFPPRSNPPRTTTQSSHFFFEEDDNYHILLLPFYNYLGDRKKSIEAGIYERLEFIKLQESLNILTKPYPSDDLKREEINSNILAISDTCNADLNIWGNFALPDNSDTTLINIKYHSRNHYDESVLVENVTDQTGLQKIQTVLILAEGELTSTIENIVYWALGIMAFRQGDYPVAINRFEQMRDIEASAELAKKSSAIAECYIFLKDLPQALAFYNEALRQDSVFLLAINNKAKILIELERYEEAYDLLKQAVTLSPNNEIINRNFQIIRAFQDTLSGDSLQHRQRIDWGKLAKLPLITKRDSTDANKDENPQQLGDTAQENSDILKGVIIPLFSIGKTEFVAEKDKKYGILYNDGTIKIPFQYDFVKAFDDGRILIRHQGKFGLIDPNKESIIHPRYSDIAQVDESHFMLNNNLLSDTLFLEGYISDVLPSGYESNLFSFDDIGSFHQGQAITRSGRKWGCIDRDSNIVIPFKYQSLQRLIGDLYLAKINNKKGVLKRDGSILIHFEHQYISYFHAYTFKVKNDNKYGIIDTFNHFLIPTIYEDIFRINANLYKVKKEGKIGLIDDKNNVLTPFEYEDLVSVKGSIFKAKKNEKYGLIHSNNKIITPLIYNSLNYYKEGFYLVDEAERYGLIDLKNNIIIAVIYESVEYLKKGLYLVKKEGKYGVVNTKNENVLALVYEDIKTDGSSNYIVKQKNKYGLVHSEDSIMIPILYENLIPLNRNFYSVQSDKKYAIADINHNLLTPFNYDRIEYLKLSSNLYRVLWKQKTGVIDKSNQFIIEPIYDNIDFFPNKTFRVQKNKKQGILGLNNKVILPIYFDAIFVSDVDAYSKTPYIVSVDKAYGLFDYNGQKLLSIKYTDITEMSKNNFLVRDGSFYGVFDHKGKKILPIKYASIEKADRNVYLVRKDYKYGLVNHKNKKLIDLKYDAMVPIGMGSFDARIGEHYFLITKKQRDDLTKASYLVERNFEKERKILQQK